MSTVGQASPPISPLAGDRIERAFDGFFERRHKGASMAISEVPNNEDEGDEKHLQPPQSPRYAHYVEHWDSEPAPLPPTPLYDKIIDIVLTAAPLLLFVYAIFAVLLKGRPTSANYFLGKGFHWSADLYGPAMMEAQSFMPTIFPMIAGLEFARFIHAFALYRIERGTRLGFIEQLMSSQSLGGTVASLWTLRLYLNGVGVALICLWALAPIGSRVSLSIISSNGTLTQNEHLSYMNTNATPAGFLLSDRDMPFYVYSVNGMYSSSMLTPAAATSPQDPWTNVKIPSIEWLTKHDGCDAEGWCSFGLAKQRSDPEGDDLTVSAGTWSSLTGVPVVGGYYGLGVQNFSVESSYFRFDCNEWKTVEPSVGLTSTLPQRPSSYNTESDSVIWNSNSTTSPNSFFLDTDTPIKGVGDEAGDARDNPNDVDASIPPRNITFGSRGPNGTSLARCGVTLTHVESEVVCNFTAPLWNLDLGPSGRSAAGACRVNRVRYSLVDKRPIGWTPLDEGWSIPQRFFDSWPEATGLVPLGSSSPTEKFIHNVVSTSAGPEVQQPIANVNWQGYAPQLATSATGSSAAPNNYVDLVKDLTAEDFTARFALLFNTYWHAFCNLQAITETEIGLGFSDQMPQTVMFNLAPVTMQLPGQHYTITWWCLAVFLVCSLFAQITGLLALVLKYRTLIPDILGSVSTLARDSPYTDVPEGGSTLDGSEYARKVRNMPVRVLDTSPGTEVGHIALSTIAVGGGLHQDVEGGQLHGAEVAVRKGRLYI